MRKKVKLVRYVTLKHQGKTIHLVGTAHLAKQSFYRQSANVLQKFQARKIPILSEDAGTGFWKCMLLVFLPYRWFQKSAYARFTIGFLLFAIFTELSYRLSILRERIVQPDNDDPQETEGSQDALNKAYTKSIDASLSDVMAVPGIYPSWLSIVLGFVLLIAYCYNLKKIYGVQLSKTIFSNYNNYLYAGLLDQPRRLFMRDKMILENILKELSSQDEVLVHFGMYHTTKLYSMLKSRGWRKVRTR